ncbi:hypothetical protein PESHB5_00630 [Pediococcus parvulus]
MKVCLVGSSGAQAKSFFDHLKTEFFYNRDWLGKFKEEFISVLASYIEWYNTKS